MPFDEEDENDEPSEKSQKIGLKKVSTQKSIFDSMPKKATQEDFELSIKKVQERDSKYKTKMADLAVQFFKALSDKTLFQNKNLFQKELDNELLKNMIGLAQEINADIKEREGEGSLSLITLLLKNSLNQRDKINKLEYEIVQLNKKIINLPLDSNKKSE